MSEWVSEVTFRDAVKIQTLRDHAKGGARTANIYEIKWGRIWVSERKGRLKRCSLILYLNMKLERLLTHQLTHLLTNSQTLTVFTTSLMLLSGCHMIRIQLMLHINRTLEYLSMSEYIQIHIYMSINLYVLLCIYLSICTCKVLVVVIIVLLWFEELGLSSSCSRLERLDFCLIVM